MRAFSSTAATLAVSFLTSAAWADPSATRAPSRVSVLTMGPGDAAFARFGHNAILLEWDSEPARIYNFGTFAFHGLAGVEDFMAGRFRYWLSVSTLPRTLRFYAGQQRSITAQELALSESERATLADALEENALEENRFYNYDYYYDNCSTRVRDALNRLLGGALERQIVGPGRLSFRGHTERLTADAGWLYFGLDLALGPLTDGPTTRWQELFIPEELHDALALVRHSDHGVSVPLVRSERTLLGAARPPSRKTPPFRAPWFGALGAAVGLGLAGLGRASAASRVARIAFGVLSALLGLVLGLLGSVFVVFWAFTKHWSAYRNEKILVCPPWALALVALGVGLSLGRARSTRLTQRVLQTCAATSVVALLVSWLPHVGQDNTRVAALLAPIWLGLYVGASRLCARPVWPFGARVNRA